MKPTIYKASKAKNATKGLDKLTIRGYLKEIITKTFLLYTTVYR